MQNRFISTENQYVKGINPNEISEKPHHTFSECRGLPLIRGHLFLHEKYIDERDGNLPVNNSLLNVKILHEKFTFAIILGGEDMGGWV